MIGAGKNDSIRQRSDAGSPARLDLAAERRHQPLHVRLKFGIWTDRKGAAVAQRLERWR